MPISKERYEERKAKNLCVQCNRSVGGLLGGSNGRVRCDPCLSKNVLRRLVVRTKRKQEGKCTECSNNTTPGRSLCKTCSHKHSEASIKRYFKHKQEGKCRTCGAATENNESRCPKHKQWFKDWRKLQKQLKIQED